MEVISRTQEKKLSKQTNELVSRPLRSVKVPAAVMSKIEKLVERSARLVDAAVEIDISYYTLNSLLKKRTVSGQSWDKIASWYESQSSKPKTNG